MDNQATPDESGQLILSESQLLLYKALIERNAELANMYLGAVCALSQPRNPERFAQAAHSLRELIDKIPRYIEVDMKAHGERLGNKVDVLEKRWEGLSRKTKCLQDGQWRGPIDESLSGFLQELRVFFQWREGHSPRRKQETSTLFRKLSGSDMSLPHSLESENVSEWHRLRDYFIDILHHRRAAGEEFPQRFGDLEHFLLDRLCPRTLMNLKEIDKIICDGETNA